MVGQTRETSRLLTWSAQAAFTLIFILHENNTQRRGNIIRGRTEYHV